MKNRGLGRGLSALLKEEILPISSNELIKIVDIEDIGIGEFQPRKKFESDKIQELANSISSDGLLQPLIVIIDPEDKTKFKLVAGERRLRACKLAGIVELPVIIKNYSPDEILRVALLENIQREELSVIEEAEGYVELIKQFKYTQDELSHKLGKSRSHIANLVRLTTLSQYIKDLVSEGSLTMGHARCLIGHAQGETIANYIVQNGLNVRQAENIVKNWEKRSKKLNLEKAGKKHTKDQDASAGDLEIIAQALSEKFNTKISIENHLSGGKIIFDYNDPEHLDDILARLN